MSRRDFLKGVAASVAALPLAGCEHSVRTFGMSNTYAVVFSPDGGTCLSGAGDGSLKLWELATRKELHSFHTGSLAINSVVFSPDGRTALSGDDSGKVTLWELATRERLRNFWDPNLVLHSAARIRIRTRNMPLLAASSRWRFRPTAAPRCPATAKGRSNCGRLRPAS